MAAGFAGGHCPAGDVAPAAVSVVGKKLLGRQFTGALAGNAQQAALAVLGIMALDTTGTNGSTEREQAPRL